MPKQEVIAYKANFKPEMSEPKEGEESVEVSPAFSYDGNVLFNMHESTEDAVQMWGEKVTSDLIYTAIKIAVQNLARRYRTQEESQDAVNGFVPGTKRAAAGITMRQVKEFLNTWGSGKSKEEIEALLASL